VILLNLAKILNGLDLPITVRLVFLDGEEFNYLGSKGSYFHK
jgi:Zn-dependent M28 family amino/carboxypeptidase